MPNRTNLDNIVHHLIRAVILGGFAFYIIRLVQMDSLTLYIAPRMSIYVKLAAMGMYVIAAVQLYQAFRHWNGPAESVACDCEHTPSGSVMRNVGIYSLFVLPLLVGFITPDTTIGSAMAGKKGINLSASSAVKPQGSAPSARVSSVDDSASPMGGAASSDATASGSDLDALFPSDPFTQVYADYGKKIYKQPAVVVTEKSYMEILTTLDMFLDNFVGKKLTISGFVYRDDTIGSDRFVLGRFAVQCCTADALPYGVMVESKDAMLYKNDTWLKITGTLKKTTYNGAEIMGLKLEKIVPIKPASDPYVYPDLDFGLDDPTASG